MSSNDSHLRSSGYYRTNFPSRDANNTRRELSRVHFPRGTQHTPLSRRVYMLVCVCIVCVRARACVCAARVYVAESMCRIPKARKSRTCCCAVRDRGGISVIAVRSLPNFPFGCSLIRMRTAVSSFCSRFHYVALNYRYLSAVAINRAAVDL